jgi:hypothetical protein
MTSLVDALAEFAKANGFQGKGPLSVALVVTDHAQERGFRLSLLYSSQLKKGRYWGWVSLQYKQY